MNQVFTFLFVVLVAGGTAAGVNMYHQVNTWEQLATNQQLTKLIEVVQANPALSARLSDALKDEKITSIEYSSMLASVESSSEKNQLLEQLKALSLTHTRIDTVFTIYSYWPFIHEVFLRFLLLL